METETDNYQYAKCVRAMSDDELKAEYALLRRAVNEYGHDASVRMCLDILQTVAAERGIEL